MIFSESPRTAERYRPTIEKSASRIWILVECNPLLQQRIPFTHIFKFGLFAFDHQLIMIVVHLFVCGVDVWTTLRLKNAIVQEEQRTGNFAHGPLFSFFSTR